MRPTRGKPEFCDLEKLIEANRSCINNEAGETCETWCETSEWRFVRMQKLVVDKPDGNG